MNIRHITNRDSEYPSLLKEIGAPPQRLWLVGAVLQEEVRLTVVGSRKPTRYGIKMTQKLIQEVASAGVTIVSGLALGIDALAHKAALDAGGKTIAVMAGGLDRIYPATNTALARRILENGGTLISEYPEKTEFFKQNFVARNRIQSGLSDAVLIVEAAEKSGTLITAQFAIDQNRTVLALPGNIDSPNSVGTNELIKTGATPVTSASDILEALGINTRAAKVKQYKPENHAEEVILGLIKSGTDSSEELQVESQLSLIDFTTTLTMLEIKDIITQPTAGTWDLK